MDSTFTPDPQLQQVATEAAEKCAAFLQETFGKSPDYSDRFVSQVEDVMNLLHLDLCASKPPESVVQDVATMFGSYLGETFRRCHGGEWGLSNGSPALSAPTGLVCYPWMRAFKRLKSGFEDNVLHWYHHLVEHGTNSYGPPPLPKGPPPLPSM